MSEIQIQTRDGSCRSFVYRPGGNGPWPAVLVYMDGPGIRPAIKELAERLAGYGYFVLLPDLFYRAGAYEPMDPRVIFSNREKYKPVIERFFSMATPALVMSDTQAFLDFLAKQPDVRPGGIATTGYCMGGRMSLVAAGTYPDRILATASYHGGRLATDAPDSPHLLAAKIKSRVYVGGAIEDPTFPDGQKQRLAQSLSAAHVDYTIETYPARHGWVLRDTEAYDAEASEKHWVTLIALLKAKLAN